uniref:Uncharacterized protein n=1 Tax=Anopheles maculatus TaxID=74869 RepID=A0A182SBB3_9DIPT
MFCKNLKTVTARLVDRSTYDSPFLLNIFVEFPLPYPGLISTFASHFRLWSGCNGNGRAQTIGTSNRVAFWRISETDAGGAYAGVLWLVGYGPSEPIHSRYATATGGVNEGGRCGRRQGDVYDNIPCIGAFRSRRRTTPAAPAALVEGRPEG